VRPQKNLFRVYMQLRSISVFTFIVRRFRLFVKHEIVMYMCVCALNIKTNITS